MNKRKSFTVMELPLDAECSMIATILDVEDSNNGHILFNEKVKKALEAFYDDEVTVNIEFNDETDLFCGTAYEDFSIIVNGNENEIRIFETWIY